MGLMLDDILRISVAIENKKREQEILTKRARLKKANDEFALKCIDKTMKKILAAARNGKRSVLVNFPKSGNYSHALLQVAQWCENSDFSIDIYEDDVLGLGIEVSW